MSSLPRSFHSPYRLHSTVPPQLWWQVDHSACSAATLCRYDTTIAQSIYWLISQSIMSLSLELSAWGGGGGVFLLLFIIFNSFFFFFFSLSLLWIIFALQVTTKASILIIANLALLHFQNIIRNHYHFEFACSHGPGNNFPPFFLYVFIQKVLNNETKDQIFTKSWLGVLTCKIN